MNPDDVPQEWAEAGARATYTRVAEKWGLHPWEDTPDHLRSMAYDDARSVLAAVIPQVKGAALREAAREAHVLDRADDPVSAAFYWLHRRATSVEANR